MSSISTKALIATVGQPLLVAGTSCNSVRTPADCMSMTNTTGHKTCSWMMLSGSCEDDDKALGSPANCCASQVEDSPCQWQTSEISELEGLCIVPNARQNSAPPSLNDLTHWLRYAYAIYCTESEVKNWNCGENCDAVSVSHVQFSKVIGYTDNIEHAAMVGYDKSKGEIVVSFRGTDNDEAFIENWMTNLDIFKHTPTEIKSKYPNAKVHSGFWNAWADMRDGVLSGISEVMKHYWTKKKITVVGHSLGAAMATNAALDLKLNHGFSTSVVNFGSPRAGDEEYHKALNKELDIWRVTHNNDLVPHVPPQINGFYHAAQEIHFGDRHSLDYKVCDGSGEDDHCANACVPYLTCTSIDDHMHYLQQSITCGSSSVVV